MHKQNKNAHSHRSTSGRAPAGHHKRHGHHQKRTGHFLKVYTPYLPLVIFTALSLLLTLNPAAARGTHSGSDKSVLAYATEMSQAGLIGSTNSQRSANGVGGLTVNGKLNAAAQAKANDMATRNYWSHNTPEGNPPWTFITNAGYSYSRAGENLAYGYNTSTDTINAWMASPSHRDNLLNANFTEVGFGIVDAPAYNGVKSTPSEETIVVAMYATPYTAPAPAASSPSKPSTKAGTTSTQPTPAAGTDASGTDPAEASDIQEKDNKPATTAASTNNPTTPTTSRSPNRLQLFTKQSLPWFSAVFLVLSLVGGAIVLAKHGLAFHRFILQGERYVLQHALFDMTVVSMVAFFVIASQQVGTIL